MQFLGVASGNALLEPMYVNQFSLGVSFARKMTQNSKTVYIFILSTQPVIKTIQEILASSVKL
jgi:hypothetical protein